MNSVILANLRDFAGVQWEKLVRQFDDLDALRQRLDYQTYILAAAGLVSSLLLGFADLATHGSIEARRNEDIQATLQQVLPDSLHDNVLLDDVKAITEPDNKAGTSATPVYIARRNGAVTGVAFKFIATGGYSGPIVLMIGMDRDGAVLGVRVVAHAETPGLGDKIEIGKSPWILSFNSRSLDNTTAERWKVKKDGGDFDQFAGATITPRAVVHGVESGLKFFKRHREELLE
jgi:electron transport complex protein RnfG